MLAIKNVRIIDGTGQKPAESSVILIENGVFSGVGSDIDIPESASVINGEGLTALPGLIDMHTHMGGSGGLDHPGAGTRTETYDYTEAREGFLRWGVTTVRTCGDIADDMLAFRNDVEAGKIVSPRVVCCGPFVQHSQGHPWATVYMKNPIVAEKCCIFADKTDIEKQIAETAASGVDFIKVFYAHLNKMDYPNTVPRLTKQELCRVVAAAHNCGLKCACHVDGPVEMMDAIDAGVDFIEHMIGAGGESTVFTDEMLEKVKASGAVVDPTLVSVLRFDETPGFKSVWRELKAAAYRFYEAGIPLAVGCDSGIPFVPFGESLHDEMALLAEAGIPAGEVIRMATLGNAEALGLSDKIGSIAPGKEADLLLVGGDPLSDIAQTKSIRAVFRRGRLVFHA